MWNERRTILGMILRFHWYDNKGDRFFVRSYYLAGRQIPAS